MNSPASQLLPTIDVLHYSLKRMGGAERLSAELCASLLRSGFEIRLLTLDRPEISKASFRTMMGEAEPKELTFPSPPVLLRVIARLLPTILLKHALSGYLVAGHHSNSVVSTFGELPQLRNIDWCYIHFPTFVSSAPDYYLLSGRRTNWSVDILRRIQVALAKAILFPISRGRKLSAQILTNSRWSARHIERIYGAQSTVLQNAVSASAVVDPSDLFAVVKTSSPLRFVALGRIVEQKRLLEIGHELVRLQRAIERKLHFTIIGHGTAEYVATLRSRLPNEIEWNIAEGLSDTQRDQLLAKCHFGVHGFPHEHFGRAVAEMQAVGLPVFGPSDGGAADIIGDPRRLFDDISELPELVANFIADAKLADFMPERLRSNFTYGQDAFDSDVASLFRVYRDSQ